MAKAKIKTGKASTNRHLHARVAFLKQAATYLATGNPDTVLVNTERPSEKNTRNVMIKGCDDARPASNSASTEGDANMTGSVNDSGDKVGMTGAPGLSLRLSSHLKTVAQRSQIRLDQNTKHGICKACGSPLLESLTCSKRLENLSKGGRKPWADVLVVTCATCSCSKRFPIGIQRQAREERKHVKKARSKKNSNGS